MKTIRNFISSVASIVFLSIPFVSYATTPTDFKSLISLFLSYINILIPFVISLTVLLFVWGVFKYVNAGASVDDRTEGRKFMLYGIISLFVMVSVWGFVNILNTSIFGGTLYIPQVK